MFLGMKNAKEGGCSSDYVHILNVIFFQTLSWQLIAFFKIVSFLRKNLKKSQMYVLLILIFYKILVSTLELIFLKSSVLISFSKPLNIFHWCLTLSAESHALACERSDQCSVLRQWGERVGSICSNSSNRFCPAEGRCDKNWGEYKKVERN